MGKLLFDKTVKFDSKSGKLAHSGYLSRSDAIEHSNRAYQYLKKRCEELGIKLSYDLSYNGFPNELIITEAFGGHGCLIIHPADDKFTDKLLRKCGKGDRDYQFLKENKDKYALFKANYGAKQVVILPGTNLLGQIAKSTLEKLTKRGAVFKPHPITTEFYLREIAKVVGKDNLLSKYASGAEVMEQADHVHVSCSTELGLYAKLHGKRVSTFPIQYRNRGSYYGLYQEIHRLEELLSTPRSGVIFNTDDYEEQIDEYLDYWKQSLDNHARNTKGYRHRRSK